MLGPGGTGVRGSPGGGYAVGGALRRGAERLAATPSTECWLDATAIVHGPLTVRGRRAGDCFQPLGMAQAKRLQDFLVDARVPRSTRGRLPLVLADDRIAWVVGTRIAEWARVPAGLSGSGAPGVRARPREMARWPGKVAARGADWRAFAIVREARDGGARWAVVGGGEEAASTAAGGRQAPLLRVTLAGGARWGDGGRRGVAACGRGRLHGRASTRARVGGGRWVVGGEAGLDGRGRACCAPRSPRAGLWPASARQMGC